MRAKISNIKGHFASNIPPQHKTNIRYQARDYTNKFQNISTLLLRCGQTLANNYGKNKLCLKITTAFWNVLSGWCRLFYFINPCDEIPLCLSQINLLQDWCSRGRSSCLFCVGWGWVRVQNRNSVFTQNSLFPLLTLYSNWYIYTHLFFCERTFFFFP